MERRRSVKLGSFCRLKPKIWALNRVFWALLGIFLWKVSPLKTFLFSFFETPLPPRAKNNTVRHFFTKNVKHKNLPTISTGNHFLNHSIVCKAHNKPSSWVSAFYLRSMHDGARKKTSYIIVSSCKTPIMNLKPYPSIFLQGCWIERPSKRASLMGALEYASMLVFAGIII